MYWNDDDETETTSPSKDKIDHVFQLVGSTLPQNYLSGFADALYSQVDWWKDNSDISFHVVIAGEEGNGWFRGNDPGEVIYISRRNMIVVRGPKHLSGSIETLVNIELDVLQHGVKLKHKHNKAIKPAPTLYSRHMVCGEMEESAFVEQVIHQLASHGIKCKKILCGKKRTLNISGNELVTRSLMLEDLGKEDSVVIQAKGLDQYQKMGCGVFIPHKSVK